MDLAEICRSRGQVEIVDGIVSPLFVVNLIWSGGKHDLRREIQFVVVKTLFSGDEGISFTTFKCISYLVLKGERSDKELRKFEAPNWFLGR